MKLDVAVPAGWRLVPLWALFTRSKLLGYTDEPMLSVFREHGVVQKDSLPNLNKTAEDRSIYQLVDDGWLVVNRMKAFQGSVGIAFQRGIVSGHYICFRPNHSQSSRYLNWLLRSDVYRTIFHRLSRGVRPGQIEIDNDYLHSVPVLLPPLDVQRRIADFLDDQVGRIDQAMRLRAAQVELVAKAFAASGDRVLEGMKVEGPPLSAVANIVDTEHKTAPTVPGGKFWIAGTSAIREGVLRRGQLRETNHSAFVEWTRRAVPAVGDVLVTREAPVGEVALLREADPPVAIGQRVVLIRPRDGANGGFLRAVLMSSVLDRVVHQTTQGSLHPHLNMADIARIRIPKTSLAKQEGIAQEHAALLGHVAALRDCLLSGRALLMERKRSLITVAVTGEFDVTAASSRAGDAAMLGVGGSG